ncbi:4-alpha-glucanotransferase [Vallitalea longa]|uniref:4-alpha-glucanotransferase n=1 Tax=Vallitalea longa TaxID=2936439 RepID=A0A9W6DFB3_9FIRM|nr:4-alpha-glucanotransferase [Vallitalea longa]GKX28519.1 4-alpha-glucanotransferase [Vallitalea longa]
MINIKSEVKNNRLSGILLHPTSLPSKYGIGDLGKSAYNFIDFLAKTKQKIWQVLPLGHTGFGDSPYQSFSSFAGQPLIISPDKLIEMRLLRKEECYTDHKFSQHKIDYSFVIKYKFSILKKAYNNFLKTNDNKLYNKWLSFCGKEKSWLEDYALFMACKDYFNGSIWNEWDDDISTPTKETKLKWINKLSYDIDFYKFIQFIFYEQWFNLKAYANEHEIYIIGDLPIFTSYDSSDVWANKELFSLDSHGCPTEIAGVPPDYFSATGQLWGNPLYNWNNHKKTSYKWWVSRLAHILKLVDFVRIDHFRGFESYWAIPYGSKTAISGKWKKGPNKELLNAFINELGTKLPIIAEDLGIITNKVKKLRDEYNLPGIKVLQFAFEDLKDNDFLPHNYNTNSVCYSGTHDNDTTLSWYKKTDEINRDKVRRYMNTDAKDITWDFIRTCFGSVSKIAVIPLQDILSLDNDARMNTPGTSMGNWQWRYTDDMLTNNISKKLLAITELYGRG